MEAYVTLEIGAELEGMKYDAFQKSVARKRDKYLVRTVVPENGGREVVMVAVSSLSKSARNAWKEREKLRLLAEAKSNPETEKPADIRADAPWYVGTDLEWYMSTYKENYYRGIELRGIIQKFLQYDDRGRTQYAEEFSEEHLGKNKRTLYRYLESYNEALAWVDRLAGRTDAITAFSQYWHCAGNRSRQACSRHSRRKSNRRSRTSGSTRILRRTTARGKCFMKSFSF